MGLWPFPHMVPNLMTFTSLLLMQNGSVLQIICDHHNITCDTAHAPNSGFDSIWSVVVPLHRNGSLLKWIYRFRCGDGIQYMAAMWDLFCSIDWEELPYSQLLLVVFHHIISCPYLVHYLHSQAKTPILNICRDCKLFVSWMDSTMVKFRLFSQCNNWTIMFLLPANAVRPNIAILVYQPHLIWNIVRIKSLDVINVHDEYESLLTPSF